MSSINRPAAILSLISGVLVAAMIAGGSGVNPSIAGTAGALIGGAFGSSLYLISRDYLPNW